MDYVSYELFLIKHNSCSFQKNVALRIDIGQWKFFGERKTTWWNYLCLGWVSGSSKFEPFCVSDISSYFITCEGEIIANVQFFVVESVWSKCGPLRLTAGDKIDSGEVKAMTE